MNTTVKNKTGTTLRMSFKMLNGNDLPHELLLTTRLLWENKFCLSLHYNEANIYLFVNDTEIYKFKAKDSEIVAAPLCLGNISKDWSVDNMKKLDFTVMFMILVLIMMQLQLTTY